MNDKKEVNNDMELVSFQKGHVLHYNGIPFVLLCDQFLGGKNENKKLAQTLEERGETQ